MHKVSTFIGCDAVSLQLLCYFTPPRLELTIDSDLREQEASALCRFWRASGSTTALPTVSVKSADATMYNETRDSINDAAAVTTTLTRTIADRRPRPTACYRCW